jgi:hypothetical protein
MRTRGYTDSDIIEAVQSSFSMAQVLRLLGLSPTGANYQAMYANFSRLKLDTAHFTGQKSRKGQYPYWTPKRPLAEILVKNSTYRDNYKLKRRLLREGLLVNRCYKCGRDPVWQGQPLKDLLLPLEKALFIRPSTHRREPQLDLIIFPVAYGANIVASGWLIEDLEPAGRTRMRHGPSLDYSPMTFTSTRFGRLPSNSP